MSFNKNTNSTVSGIGKAGFKVQLEKSKCRKSQDLREKVLREKAYQSLKESYNDEDSLVIAYE